MVEAGELWLKDLRTGKEEAVQKLVATFSEPLRRYLTGMVRNEADAEELVQETFLRFLHSLGSFRGDCSIKSYLYRIAHNLAVNHLSSAAHTREFSTDKVGERPDSNPSPHDRLREEERSVFLRESLRSLPPQQRTVVLLRAWQEMTFKEIATVLSLAEGTVKAHYFFALKNLRKRMEVGDEP